LSAAGRRRVVVIGLDCLAPALAFGRCLHRMPTLARLMREGVWAELRSCDPPITIPAWAVMATGVDPGTLGMYGFRHRRGRSYTEAWTANARSLRQHTVWDLLGVGGRRTCLVGFPPSYPTSPIPGWRVGCFLTPGPDRPFATPDELGREVLATVPDYRFDVPFRTDDRRRVMDELVAMLDGHFRLLGHLATTREWDLLWFVEIATDRLHHAFWKFMDPEHPLHDSGAGFSGAIEDFYALVDHHLDRLMALLPDDADVLVVSDHGAKAMRGAFAINEWLSREGYLALRSRPVPGTPLERADVDWSCTRAWAWGGYYARLFLNVEGREETGTLPPERCEETLAELTGKLTALQDERGRPLHTRVLRPQALYRESRGDAPDAMVYLDDLSWRAAGTVGWDSLHMHENDTGPDDAVHDFAGCLVARGPHVPARGRIPDASIYDVAPTLLGLFETRVPAAMAGVPLW
jgi:predicted AlkP superfamily phosphohydrolase/phosphomutase